MGPWTLRVSAGSVTGQVGTRPGDGRMTSRFVRDWRLTDDRVIAFDTYEIRRAMP
jgi:hypothetical protein